MLRAVGFKDEDFAKPQVGIASTWSMLTPCNMHIDGSRARRRAGADAAGGKSIMFNTITVSDGISMGTPGMRYSLVSREVIADSIETVVGGEGFDGLVAIGGCDKNMPGCAMAIARLNRPAVFVYGGTIQPGHRSSATSSRVFEAVGSHAAGKIDDAELREVESHRDPGARLVRRHVHGQHDGIGDRSARHEPAEQLGAGSRVEREEQRLPARGRRVVELIKRGIKPSDILTQEAFENAITTVIALGGSTNAVLHLLAIAHAGRRSISTLDDFTRIGKRVPVLADLRPSGRYLMSELIAIGGIQPLHEDAARRGLAARRLPHRHGQDARRESRGRASRIRGPGHRSAARRTRSSPTAISSCSTATSRRKARSRRSPARKACVRGPRAGVRRRGATRCAAILDGTVVAGDVVVIRYEGPKGGPGMREMLSPTGAIMGRGSATRSR